MSENYNLVDDLFYTWAWLHKAIVHPSTKSTPYVNTMHGRYHRLSDGDRLPMSKGTMKNKIRFEFPNTFSANKVATRLRDVKGLEVLELPRAVEFTLQPDVPKEQSLLTIYDVMSRETGHLWTISGPKCSFAWEAVHSKTDIYTATVRKNGELVWLCACGLSQPTDISEYLTLTDFQEELAKGTRQAAKLLTFSDQSFIGRRFILQSSAADFSDIPKELRDLPAKTIQLHDEIVIGKERNVEMPRGVFDREVKQRPLNEQDVEKYKTLSNTTDSMFRFLSGLNMQDHSVADQKEFYRLMRSMKEALQAVGIGSKD